MTSGTAGWKIKPSTMPMASDAIPIMPGFPSASLARGALSAALFSLGPILFGEFEFPDRAGGQRQTVGDVDRDADAVGDLQQPKPLQCGTVVEDVAHRVRRP